jgi:hypothetical protein
VDQDFSSCCVYSDETETALEDCVLTIVPLGNFNLCEIMGVAQKSRVTRQANVECLLSALSPFLTTLFSVFRSRAAFQAKILALRHQIGVLRRSAKKHSRHVQLLP